MTNTTFVAGIPPKVTNDDKPEITTLPATPLVTVAVVVLVVSVLLVAVFATSLVRRGEVRAGVSVFFVAMLAVFAVFPVVGQDARLSAVYLVVPVAIAGVTLGRVGVAVVTGAALVIAVGMTWRYPPVDPPPGTVEIIIAAVTLVVKRRRTSPASTSAAR